MQGINAISGEHCLIANNAADFAEVLTTLLDDLNRAQEIDLAGPDHVAGLCSPQPDHVSFLANPRCTQRSIARPDQFDRVELALKKMLNPGASHPRSINDWLRMAFTRCSCYE